MQIRKTPVTIFNVKLLNLKYLIPIVLLGISFFVSIEYILQENQL